MFMFVSIIVSCKEESKKESKTDSATPKPQNRTRNESIHILNQNLRYRQTCNLCNGKGSIRRKPIQCPRCLGCGSVGLFELNPRTITNDEFDMINEILGRKS